MNLGLTGGIATGKSTVAQYFESDGWSVVRTDLIGHEVLTRPEVKEAIKLEFGISYFLPSGEINRKSLGALVFMDSEARKKLNDSVHPLIRIEWKKQVKEAQLLGKNVLVEIPLLYETQAENSFDYIVAVGCSEATQKRRLMEHRQISENEAQNRIDAQLSLVHKLLYADFVVWNEFTAEVLKDQVMSLLRKLASK
ncbi:MAG: dephospho-CoA kinase [Verrucomicrobiota bacterium]|nr:dephospho-CoA kinase [Verrucomicrobiota bacterium]